MAAGPCRRLQLRLGDKTRRAYVIVRWRFNALVTWGQDR